MCRFVPGQSLPHFWRIALNQLTLTWSSTKFRGKSSSVMWGKSVSKIYILIFVYRLVNFWDQIVIKKPNNTETFSLRIITFYNRILYTNQYAL